MSFIYTKYCEHLHLHGGAYPHQVIAPKYPHDTHYYPAVDGRQGRTRM